MQHKQLPANPSLEHLKSQAKQLLKAHKDGSPDALQRIRSFFPKLSDATDVEIQNAAFGLQDAQLVIAREYGFASWTRLKGAVLYQEQSVEETSTKDLLFQILGTPDPTQTDIQRVEELITAALDVTERLLETTKPAASVITNALVFACEVYQPEKVRLLLKHGADPSASLKAKFRYDVVQNLKLDDDDSHTCEKSPLFLPGTKTLTSETLSHTEYTIEFVPKLKGTKTLASETLSYTYEMSPLLVAIGTWYGVREAAEALDECLEIVEILLEDGADVHRSYRVDIEGEILELTPLAYTQKLASLFPDKPFDRIIEVLLAAGAI